MFMSSGASRQGNADGRLGISVAPASSPAAMPGDELHLLVVALSAALEPLLFVAPENALVAQE